MKNIHENDDLLLKAATNVCLLLDLPTDFLPSTSEHHKNLCLVYKYLAILLGCDDGDKSNMKVWLSSYNTGICGTPQKVIRTPKGAETVLSYLQGYIAR